VSGLDRGSDGDVTEIAKRRRQRGGGEDIGDRGVKRLTCGTPGEK